MQKLGPNLFLVAGVPTIEKTPTQAVLVAPPLTTCAHARQLLDQARQAGDRPAQVSALTDWGAATLASGDVQNALLLLEPAHKLACELGDQARETDALYNLGKAARLAGQSARAQQCLGQVVSTARAAGDRFAEKLALEQLGKVYASQGETLREIAAYEQALELSRAVGHRQHQADLLWTLAVLHAQEGHREKAAALGKAAHLIFVQLGHPSAGLLDDALQAFSREGEAPISSAEPIGPATVQVSSKVPTGDNKQTERRNVRVPAHVPFKRKLAGSKGSKCVIRAYPPYHG
jgi:tetratricopeptide (TPR) repeat protein